MTIKEIISMIQIRAQRLGVEVEVPALAQIELGNEAQASLCNEHFFRFMVTTSTTPSVASQSEYQLPDDFVAIIDVRQDITPLKMVRVTITDLDDVEPNPTIEQNPYYYVLLGDRIILYPTPATNGITITMRYYRSPARMTALTHAPDIPARYHDAVMLKALAAFLQLHKRGREAGQIHAEYRLMVDAMKKADSSKGDLIQQMGSSRGFRKRVRLPADYG